MSCTVALLLLLTFTTPNTGDVPLNCCTKTDQHGAGLGSHCRSHRTIKQEKLHVMVPMYFTQSNSIIFHRGKTRSKILSLYTFPYSYFITTEFVDLKSQLPIRTQSLGRTSVCFKFIQTPNPLTCSPEP